MVLDAEKDGKIKPGTTLIEPYGFLIIWHNNPGHLETRESD